MSGRRLAFGAAVVAVSATVALVVGDVGSRKGTDRPAHDVRPVPTHANAHERPAAVRTLVVSSQAEPAPSQPGQIMRGRRVEGAMPSRTSLATVLTDEDCSPDAAGVSHCRNKIRLSTGRTLTVRHPHRMAEVPCMVPGERIRVEAA